jgi:glycoside/pentoside/hexuronide:cation symporter, GPH family
MPRDGSTAMKTIEKPRAAERAAKRHLPQSRLWLYGVGEIPITAAMVLFGLFLLFFYNSVLGVPAPLAGLAFAAGLALDAVLDPFIGFRSDRSRHALGRRRSFMLAGSLTMGACFALLFCPPRSLGTVGVFSWLLGCSMLFRFTTAVYRIPYLSLGAELSEDYDERTIVMAVRAVCGLVGALIAAALSFVLFFRNGAAGADAKLTYANYPKMGIAFGALLTVAGLVAFFGTAGHRDPAVVADSAHISGFWAGFRTAMANRSFRAVWSSFTLFYAAVILNATLSVQFFTWCAKITDAATLSQSQVSFGVGACCGVALWMALVRRGEKRTWYATGMLGTSVILAGATLLIGPGKLLGVGHAWSLLAGYGVAGIFASALWVLPPSMLADVADQDQSVTGSRREGVYFGMLNFGEKIASGFAVLLAGVLLQYFVRLAPASAVQTPDTVGRLSLLFGLAPGLMLIGSLILIMPYNLGRSATREIQRRLAGAIG